jgi:glycerophosphoryl diester phosphodiesterase
MIDLSPERRLTVRLKPEPIWISHRGLRSSGQTENTAKAFDCAILKGFSCLETDLRLTRDGHIVLLHDENLDRVTGALPRNPSPTNLKNLTRSEVENIVLPCGGNLLFLDEFIKCFYQVNWLFDVKPESARECLRKLRTMINEMSNPEEVVAKISFVLWSKADEHLAKELFSGATFFARPSECWRAALCALLGLGNLAGIKAGRAYSLTARLGPFVPISLFTRRLFKEYHSRGAKITLYLANSEGDLIQGLDAGADFILSDGLILGSREVAV